MMRLLRDTRGMIGGIEWLIILIIALLFLFGGAKKIPELARGLGRALGEFQRGRIEAEQELRRELEAAKRAAGPPPIEIQAQQLTTEELQVIQAAKSLGIDVEGKSIEQLKKELIRKLLS